MPRGNLEVIYPRVLCLATLRQLLDKLLYKEAILLARKHRIDMNVLYDHSPEQFIRNTDTFVHQIGDPDLLNLFLSALRYDNPFPIFLSLNY